MRARCATILTILLGLGLLAAPPSLGGQGWYGFPTLHGDDVIFVCEGDLWRGSIHGVQASRLTSWKGFELMPRFSPDGDRVAYTADYEGNPDVYVTDLEGGVPRRLSFHPGSDQVVGWNPEGDRVLFRSRRDSGQGEWEVYSVDVQGGLPEKLPLGPAALLSFGPEGRIAFNRFSREFRTWKRYLGGRAQQVWIGNPATQEFRLLTDYRGTDAFPMWIGDRIYFLSDRGATANIHSMKPDGTDVRQHTRHSELDVRWPSTDGKRIVYQLGADLWMLSLDGDEARRIDIRVPSDQRRTHRRFVPASDSMAGFELSPQGKQLLVEARGDLAVVPVREARVLELTDSPGVREKFPRWSRDGRQVAYLSDRGGEERLMVRETLDGSEAHSVGDLPPGWYHPPAWTPDGQRIALGDMRGTLRVLEVESGRGVQVDHCDFGDITEYVWSPDGRYLAYAIRQENDFPAIFLFDAEDARTHRVTDDWQADFSPAWDPEGNYLYFLSDRNVDPMIGELDYEHIFDRTTKVYAVLLEKGAKSPFLPRMVDEQKEHEEWDDHPGRDHRGPGDENGKQDGEDQKWREVEVKLDLEGLRQRIVPLPVPAGRYHRLEAGKQRVYFMDRPPWTRYPEPAPEKKREPRRRLLVYDLREREMDELAAGIDDYDLAAGGQKVALRRGSKLEVRDSKSKDWGERREPETVDLARWKIRVEPRAEWRQIFREAWRRQRDFYWAEDMAKIDWPAMYDRYAALLPRIADRRELNELIGELIGELGTSHTYRWGGDIERGETVAVGLLGADLVPAGRYYRFARVLAGENWDPRSTSPLAHSHVRVAAGDYLIAIGGRPIHPPESPYERLAARAGESVRLTVNDRPTPKGARDVVVETLEGERQLRYLDWVATRRRRVEEATDGRVGYIHIPDMGGRGLHEFSRSFYPQTRREALIIDVRYNGGGSVSQMILERLYRKIAGYSRGRHGGWERYPYRAFHGPLVAITNQHAGSDGDIFTRAFQHYGLGPVIGKRSWGGVVGIRMDKRFVDGGMMSEPEFAYFFEKDGWDEENRGTIPDIEVENDPASVVAGLDPQLEKAIQVILERLEEWPPEPEPPASPDKSKDAFRRRSDLFE